MNNIEDDVKEIKKFTNASILYGNKIGITTSQHNKLREAMQNILLEREQDKARIKELEEENRIFKNKNVLVNRYFKLKDNSIPKQKVKDKIEDIKKGNYSSNYNFKGGRENGKNFKFGFKVGMLKALKELLEEGE